MPVKVALPIYSRESTVQARLSLTEGLVSTQIRARLLRIRPTHALDCIIIDYDIFKMTIYTCVRYFTYSREWIESKVKTFS